MIAKSRNNSYFHKLKFGIFFSFIFLLNSCKFFTNTINVKTNLRSVLTISGKILPLVGSIATNNRSSMLISTAQASACANPVYAKLFKLATDGSINEAAPIDSQLVGASATYSFDAKALGLSSNTNVDYMVIASGCNDVVYKRPVTNFDKYQDIDEKSSLVASVINANGLVTTNLNQAQRGDVDVLIKSISGTTVASLVASAANSAKFTQIFGVAPTVIEDAKPDIILTMPASTIYELATSAFTAESFHMDSSYPIAYSWKVDGVVKSATHILSYIPGANDSGSHQVVLLAGKDDGSGGIDLTKPYYTKNLSINVQNNILPTAPNIAINASTPSPRNSTSVDIDISTGQSRVNCASFSHLAFTETNSAPGVMQFNIDCTTTGTQTETVSFSSGEGAKTLYIWAIDSEGNISSPKSVSLVLDTLPPTASMSLSSTLFKGGSSTSVTLAASDSGAGMASLDLYFAADGSTYSLLSHLGNSDTSYSWTVPSINTSAGKLKLLATDLTGSVTTIYSSTLTIDSTAPTSPSFSISSANPTSSSVISATVSSCSDVAQVLLVESNTQPTGSESGWANCSTSAGAHTVTISGNGLHTLYLWSKDAAGNISLASTSHTVTLDTVAPVIASGPAIASAMNKGGASTNITWSLTDTTTATIELLYSTNNGSTFTSIASGLTNNGTYSWTIPSANSSTVKLKLIATDQVGLSSNATGSAFTIDSTAPAVAITTPTGPLKGGSTITLSYSATDTNTITSLQLFYAADGSTFVAPTSLTVGSTSVSWSVPSSDLATAKLKVTATDAAGNSASAVTSAFTIDSTVPTSPSFSISSANPTSSSTVSATVSSCSDAAQILLIEVNTQPTGIESGWANCSTSSGAHSISISGDGSHTIYLWSKDAAGNIATASTSASVVLDTAAPVIASGPAIASTVNKGGASTNITWSLTDTTTATVELLYSTNNGSTFTSIASGLANSGTYSWTIPAANSSTVKLKLVATDQVGLSSNATGSAFTIDSTAPTVAITTPTGPIKGGSTITLNYSATDANTISSLQLFYAADGSTFGAPTSLTVGSTSVSWSVPSSDLATAKLKVTATDAAGNSASAVTSAFTIDSTVPTSPSFSISSANPSSSAIVSATVSSCSDAAQVLLVEVNSQPTGIESGWANCSTSVGAHSITISGDGSHSIYLWSKDAAGNIATASTSASVVLDTVAPVIASGPTIASAMNKGGASTNITWSLTDTTTATVELLYSTNNGSTFTSIASGLTNNGTYSWTIPAANSSTVKLKLVATDQLGFASNATGSAFTIDSTAPTVAITTPTGPLKGGATVALSYSATDTNTISSLQLSYAADGSTFGAPTSLTVGSTSVSWNIPSADLATAKLKITATDEAGNSASAITSAFTIDSTAPTLSITAPTNASSTYATSITVSGSCSEDTRVVSVSVSDGTTTSTPVSNPTCSSGSFTSSVDISGLAIASLTVTAIHADAATNSTSQSVTISHIVPPPTKLILSGSTSTTSGTCTQYTIETQNASSVSSAVTQNTTINLSLAGSGALYSNNTCTSAITSLQINNGSSSGSFYYLNRDMETGISLTISDGTSTLTSASLTSISSNGSITGLSTAENAFGGCLLQSGGSVWCWGVGSGSDISDLALIAPLPVEGLGKAAIQVSEGGVFKCALLSDGSVKCWGSNAHGELGDGTTTSRTSPVAVQGLGGSVTAISSGIFHACAIINDGSIKCWGRNYSGELGDNTTTDRSTAVAVQGLGRAAIALAAGDYFNCALLDDGSVKCWGWNGNGSLGDNTTTDHLTAAPVQGLGAVATAITASQHACAILIDGSVKCWGVNYSGQLGDNTTTNRSLPVSVQSLGGSAIAIQTGGEFTCAILSDHTTKCWGKNDYSQLGNNSFIQSLIPVAVQNLSNVTSIALGYRQGCALLDSGLVKCWGQSYIDTFGKKLITNKLKPDLSAANLNATKIFSDRMSGSSCAILSGGSVKCWGPNYGGQLGNGSQTGSLNSPVSVINLSLPVTDLSISNQHTCAVLNDGTVRCWGADNGYAQLGDGTYNSYLTGVSVQGLGASAIGVSGGTAFSCALLNDGSIKCWGYNGFGSLGNSSTTNSLTPVSVANLGTAATSIASGWYYSCALLNDGTVKCWGQGLYGALGSGTSNRTSATSVTGLGGTVSAISSGSYHTCALMSDGTVKCWGANESGQLGDNTQSYRSSAVSVQSLGGTAIAISAGGNHTCALLNDSSLKCWGKNDYGQLGNNSMAKVVKLPVSVQGLSGLTITGISTGAAHSCALISGGEVKCWGAASGLPKTSADGVDLLSSVTTMPSIVKTARNRVRLTAGGPNSSLLSCWNDTNPCKPLYLYALTSNGGLASPVTSDEIFDLGQTSLMDYGSYNFYLNDQCSQVTSSLTIPTGSSYLKFYAVPSGCSSGKSKITVTPHDSNIGTEDTDIWIADETPSGC
jgi:alpha-tubulin suppressor-like RCC1 family protein